MLAKKGDSIQKRLGKSEEELLPKYDFSIMLPVIIKRYVGKAMY